MFALGGNPTHCAVVFRCGFLGRPDASVQRASGIRYGNRSCHCETPTVAPDLAVPGFNARCRSRICRSARSIRVQILVFGIRRTGDLDGYRNNRGGDHSAGCDRNHACAEDELTIRYIVDSGLQGRHRSSSSPRTRGPSRFFRSTTGSIPESRLGPRVRGDDEGERKIAVDRRVPCRAIGVISVSGRSQALEISRQPPCRPKLVGLSPSPAVNPHFPTGRKAGKGARDGPCHETTRSPPPG